MSRVVTLRSLVAGSLIPLLLAACSAGPLASAPSSGPGVGTADYATQTACRQRASEIYDQHNRADIFAANSSINSPFSANYQSGVSSHSLGDQFAYGQMQTDCERNTGTGAERTETPPPPVVKGR